MSKKPEDIFRDEKVLPMLRSFGYAQRIENSIGSDLADLIYCVRRQGQISGRSGWIELKHVNKWPSRFDSPLRFKHFTIGQARFLSDWYTPGAKTCVLVEVGADYFLMEGTEAKELQRGMTRSEIFKMAAVVGEKVFPAGRILLWLTN